MRQVRVLIFALLVFFIFPLSAGAQGLKAIVLPFEVHSKDDISPQRRELMEGLASSLHSAGVDIAGIDEIKELMLRKGVKRLDEEVAYELSRTVRADFAVVGSFTKFGEIAEANWRLIDLKNREAVAFYVKSSESQAELVRKVISSADEMREKMYSVLRSRPAIRTGIIDRIEVSGNRRVDREAILKKLTVKAGEPYSPDDVKEDIRTLYGTGYFDDITADLSETASGKVLTFLVKEMPYVRKVQFKGNKELKDERIKEALTLKENTVLDRVIMGENAEKIKALYAEEGYYLTVVKPVVETDGVEASVTFQIEEGPEVKVKRITFIGNRHFSDKKLKGFMNTSEKGLFSLITQSGKFDEFIFQNDLAIIMNKYFDNGFVNADVLDQRVLLSEDKKWFYITIALSEGEQFRLNSIDVAGEIIGDKEELIDKFKLKQGDVFNRSKISKGVEALTDVYGDKGYAYAEIKPRTRIDNEKKTVDVVVETKKNELVYVERIDITGNVRTRDKVIRRELEVEEGDLYSSSGLKRSRNNLRRLGYFEDVRISQTQGSANDRIKFDVDVKERPTGSISIGFGYSSVDKLIGTASVSQTNFMGTGIKLDISGTISSSSSKYVLGFTEPWLFDKPLSAGFDIYNSDREYPDFQLNKKGFDVRFGFPIGDRYTRGYVTYTRENVEITDVSEDASDDIKEQAGKSRESSVKTSIRRDTRNDAFFPSEGYIINGGVEFAGGPLSGTNHFIKYEGDAVKYFAMPWDTVFSVRAAAGYVQGYKDHDVPIYEKYYLGGINSIRGFETRAISPKDPATGDLIGGNTMFVTNLEYVFPLFSEQSVRGLVFFDLGNSYEGKLDFTDLRRGAGVGIRWYSPLGPLRLEFGFNLDRRDDESPSEWDFAIGTAF